MNRDNLIACHECDFLQRETPLVERGAARCQRCGAALYRYRNVPMSHEWALAFTLAAAILFVVANRFPIFELWINGASVETTLFGAASALYADGMWPIAGLVFVTTLLMPSLNIAAVIYLLLPLHTGGFPHKPEIVLRVLRHVAPWGMIEVLMVGMLIALVKLQHIATVVPGVGAWAFGAVMILLAAATVAFNPRELWARIDTMRGDVGMSHAQNASITAATAARAGLFACHDCGLLSKPLFPHVHAGICPRCGAVLHSRKPNSLVRTWAFLFAAMILYIPAILLPVMVTSTLFGARSDTILSGVVLLWTSGSWLLAIVVFIASIVVPVLKILSLAYLAWSTQLRSPRIPHQRTRIYRLIEFVGRWSMLDIYVITILVAFVQFGSIATIDAGPGSIAFGAVVVLTMFAALSFDPRLIWDAVESERE
ncbi:MULTISPECIES: paraquat-inducible protein A [Paraburkholderia]|uniref:Paraquat-inducible protein A n=1 Tax=Paraburkholderia madseniana TaxID=2599607 RepID=A0AAP5BHP5_9BURK|nr:MULTISPECIES: paraquat-inducible protein A [Paraburkholderia]MCX4148241.1 paraquat-inducible protein A [Paraburkholderia madseniana]MDN7151179.1 paraquat-inducible protein A [Paraburkholderia sp. WS6]MDQ6410059.1 paraquat-inducible protein A [Paraburkholderia madseniana]